MTRLEKIRESMRLSRLDGLLVTDMRNIYYLTGFSGTAGTVLLSADRAIFMTDSRYTGVARAIAQLTDHFEILETRDPLAEVAGLRLDVLGFEDSLDFASYQKLSRLTESQLQPTSQLFQTIRQIKEPDELVITRQACAITDQAFDAVLDYIAPGRTERDVANFLDFKMRELGATSVSFDSIVASGRRSALPHGVATDKVIEAGDAVTMDFGCFYKHYASDMTRTIFVGPPDPQLTAIYEVVLAANEALIAQTRAGLSYADYDRIPREIIRQAGYGEYFTHGIGHGVGLDIHELPFFGARVAGSLQAGMVVTDEPGIYLPDVGGVRIEDALLVTADGCQLLSKSSKKRIII